MYKTSDLRVNSFHFRLNLNNGRYGHRYSLNGQLISVKVTRCVQYNYNRNEFGTLLSIVMHGEGSLQQLCMMQIAYNYV